MQPKLTPVQIAGLLDYNRETGVMLWLKRPNHMFRTEHHSRSWNTRHAGKRAFSVCPQGYRTGTLFGRIYREHVIAWAIVYGRWPDGQIDHINGDRADNRIENLREVTRSENCRNAKLKATNTSGANGVVPYGKRFRAYINIHLGIFDKLEDAIAARKAAEAEIGGYHPNHGRIQAFGDQHGVCWTDEARQAA